MSEAERPKPDDLLPFQEFIPSPIPININFYKLGGTWDMVERNGRLIGTGNLGDDEIYLLEQEL